MANCAYLDLTEAQQTQIKDLRLALTERNLPLRNQLGEMRAKMQTLRTGDNQDLKAISNLIDEMSKVQSQIRKNAAANHIAVRVLLSDDQKVMFDVHQRIQGNRSKGMRGNGAGYRPGCPRVN
jgi:Spy/CpxP family protein refolding chaperone